MADGVPTSVLPLSPSKLRTRTIVTLVTSVHVYWTSVLGTLLRSSTPRHLHRQVSLHLAPLSKHFITALPLRAFVHIIARSFGQPRGRRLPDGLLLNVNTRIPALSYFAPVRSPPIFGTNVPLLQLLVTIAALPKMEPKVLASPCFGFPTYCLFEVLAVLPGITQPPMNLTKRLTWTILKSPASTRTSCPY